MNMELRPGYLTEKAKKWYLRDTDGHVFLGPFAENEVLRLIRVDNLKCEFLCWAEDSDGWRPIGEVTEFASMVSDLKDNIKIELDNITQDGSDTLNSSETDPLALSLAGALTGDEQERYFEVLKSRIQFTSEEFNSEKNIGLSQTVHFFPKQRLARSVVFGVLVSCAIFLLLKSDFLKTYPDVAELTDSENSEVHRVLSTKSADGAKATIGVIDPSSKEPAFVVAANLENGAEMVLNIKAIQGKILNGFYYSVDTVGRLRDGLFKTQRMKGFNGAFAPKGHYLLTLYSKKKDSLEMVFQNRFFLGGINDVNFSTQLREFNRQVRAKAETEITETRQLLETMEMALNDLQPEVHSANAVDFGAKNLIGQLSLPLSDWKIRVESGDAVLVDLYFDLEKILGSIQKNLYVLEAMPDKRATNSLIDELSITRSMILEVKIKAKQLEKKIKSDLMI